MRDCLRARESARSFSTWIGEEKKAVYKGSGDLDFLEEFFEFFVSFLDAFEGVVKDFEGVAFGGFNSEDRF